MAWCYAKILGSRSHGLGGTHKLQLHRQDSVEPGAAGVHLRRHLPTDRHTKGPSCHSRLYMDVGAG